MAKASHIRSLNPGVPACLDAFIARLVAKGPEQRYASEAEGTNLREGSLEHLHQPAMVPAPLQPSVKSMDPRRMPDLPGRVAFLSSSLRVPMFILLVLGILGCAMALPDCAFATQDQNIVQDAKPKEAPADPYVVWSVAISPDGKAVAAGAGWWTSGGEVGVWDLATHKALQHFAEDRGVVSVAFSPNSKLLAFAGWTHHVRVLDWAAGKEIGDFTVSGLAHVAFSRDGLLLATASEGQTLQLWDLAKSELAADLEGDLLRFHRVMFTPDGKRLLAGGGDWQPGGINHLGVWDVTSKKQLMKLVGHKNTVYCVACSPDGKMIATGSVDRSIRLWDAETGLPRKILRGPMREVDSLVFTSDGKTLLSCGPEPIIRFWDVEQGKETRQLDTGISHVRALALTADDKTLVVGGQQKTLKIFNLETGKQVAVLWNGADQKKLDMDELPAKAPQAQAPEVTRSYASLLLLALILPVILAVGLITWFLIRQRRNVDQFSAQAVATKPPPALSMIAFVCSACGAKLKVKQTLSGKKVKCSHCAKTVSVPLMEASKD